MRLLRHGRGNPDTELCRSLPRRATSRLYPARGVAVADDAAGKTTGVLGRGGANRRPAAARGGYRWGMADRLHPPTTLAAQSVSQISLATRQLASRDNSSRICQRQ
jgi:hypothetical protein